MERKVLLQGIYYPMVWATCYVVWKIKQSMFISRLKKEIGTRSFNYLIKAHKKFGKGGALTIEVLRSYSQEELLSFYGIGRKTIERINSFKTSREKIFTKSQKSLKEKEVV